MEAQEAILVTGNSGLRGTIEPSAFANTKEELLTLHLDNGEQLLVHRNALIQEENGHYHLPLSRAELERLSLSGSSPSDPLRADNSTEQRVIPVIEEQLDVRKQVVETGVVRVTKTVQQREEKLEIPVVREEVRVERIPINRIVDAPIPMRQEGETTIVSVMKEVLVVEKRLVLEEEIHITRQKIVTNQQENVLLKEEAVKIERLPIAGAAPNVWK